MKWLLLYITFVGPTSADALSFEWHATKEACETATLKKKRELRWHESMPNHVCIPMPQPLSPTGS